MTQFTISVDAMGGDFAPRAVIAGLAHFVKKDKSVGFLLYGNELECRPILEEYPILSDFVEFIHAPNTVGADMQPTKALRLASDSSMFHAINAVKEARADAVISGGNTGALVVLSKFILGNLEGIDRPGIVSAIPVSKDSSPVFLDLGANVECDAIDIVRLAYMGCAFASAVLKMETPRVALLNVGVEDIKGRRIEKEAHKILSETDINFIGYVEPTGLFAGEADVVVTDGFVGNIVVKSAEGILNVVKRSMTEVFSANLFTKLSAFISSGCLKRIANTFNPQKHNGAMFIGTNGIVVKSHGNADEVSFARAVEVTMDLVRADINSSIKEMLSNNNIDPGFISSIKKKLGL